MNFFFGIKSNYFESKIQIPKFNNRETSPNNLINLYSIKVSENKWKLEDMSYVKQDKFFFYLDSNISNNENLFFLAQDKEISNFDSEKITNLSDFTESFPSYRCNLEIFNKEGGFSSFQSEYPYSMINKKGNIFSPINVLLNIDADKNFIFFKNVFSEPKKINFFGYLVNLKTKSIIEKLNFHTNFSNLYEINKELIHPEIYFVSNKYLGIPMYISQKGNHLSFEHTHPPHEYIQSPNRFDKIRNIKKEINEIFNE